MFLKTFFDDSSLRHLLSNLAKHPSKKCYVACVSWTQTPLFPQLQVIQVDERLTGVIFPDVFRRCIRSWKWNSPRAIQRSHLTSIDFPFHVPNNVFEYLIFRRHFFPLMSLLTRPPRTSLIMTGNGARMFPGLLQLNI